MNSINLLLLCPMNTYLESELSNRFILHRFWTIPNKPQFISHHGASIRAVVGNASAGADAALIEALPKLEIVASFSVGVDKIDLGKCREKGIRVTNTPDVLTDDVADLAIGLMIAVLRRIPACDRYVRGGGWRQGDFQLTTKFSGKKVGILGLGRIGLAIAKRAEAFRCPISYYSRTKKHDSKYTYYPSVVELASNSDILVVACALTEETRHIINRKVIDALGPKGVLINIGRGPHVDEVELVSALVEGRLGGAGLDVFENEPHVPEELFKLDNVVLLPHIGSGTVETRKEMADLVLGNLEAHFLGKPLLTPLFSGKSIGIVGLGRIGSAIAKRAESFGCSISYCSRSKKSDSPYKHYESVPALAANCQILVVACSLNEETHHIINPEAIDALGPKGILINIGRGAHADETKLVSALLDGRLGGAGLDVFENEPDVPEELFALDNVVLLSHVGSDTVETCNAMADLVIANLEAHFLGEPLLTPVV